MRARLRATTSRPRATSSRIRRSLTAPRVRWSFRSSTARPTRWWTSIPTRLYFAAAPIFMRSMRARARRRACSRPIVSPERTGWLLGAGRERGVEIGLTRGRIGDDVLNLRLAVAGQRELGVADPKRLVLDQHVLIFDRALALIPDLGVEAAHIRDGDRERFAVGVFAGPGALIELGIHRDIFGLARRGGQAAGSVGGSENTRHI